MNKKELEDLSNEINKAHELSKEWVFKWKNASELQMKLRDPNLLNFFEDEIIKLKFEKLQNSIDTVWTNRHWYTWAWFLTKRNELLNIELKNNESSNKQIYFWNWQEKEIYTYLKNLFPDAKKQIIIYDNYINSELLKILSWVDKNVKINIITKDKSCSQKFKKQIEAFQVLYEINIDIQYLTNEDEKWHDRFYIIDNEDAIYSMWASIWKTIRATMFHPVNKDQWIKILNDIQEKYWVNLLQKK